MDALRYSKKYSTNILTVTVLFSFPFFNLILDASRRYAGMHKHYAGMHTRPLQGGLLYIKPLCTYVLYVPVRNVFDVRRYITWEDGRGLGPGNLEFFGPYLLDAISQGQKILNFKAPAPSHFST
jgi:hypothetical protein